MACEPRQGAAGQLPEGSVCGGGLGETRLQGWKREWQASCRAATVEVLFGNRPVDLKAGGTGGGNGRWAVRVRAYQHGARGEAECHREVCPDKDTVTVLVTCSDTHLIAKQL